MTKIKQNKTNLKQITKSTSNSSFDERREKDTSFCDGDLLDEKIKKILEMLKKRNWTIGVMESCTGGAIANCITNIPGASDVFKCGLVTYSIKAKIEAGVEEEVIKKYGVFSKETAEEMARKIEGEVGVGVTGNMNDPAEVFVAVRIGNKVESRKLKVESNNENKIEARKEKKMRVVEKVMKMISDNL